MEYPLETWIAKRDLAEKLSMAERTIERKIEAGELRSAKRPISGRRPLIVIHPEDAAALEQRTLKPIPGAPPDANPVPDKTDMTKSTPPVLSGHSVRAARTGPAPARFPDRSCCPSTPS